MIVEMIKDQGVWTANEKAYILFELSKVGIIEELKIINIKYSVEKEAWIRVLNLPFPILRCLDMLSEIERWRKEVKPLI